MERRRHRVLRSLFPRLRKLLKKAEPKIEKPTEADLETLSKLQAISDEGKGDLAPDKPKKSMDDGVIGIIRSKWRHLILPRL